MGNANALEIATRLGFEPRVVEAARELLESGDMDGPQNPLEKTVQLLEQLENDIADGVASLQGEQARLAEEQQQLDAFNATLESTLEAAEQLQSSDEEDDYDELLVNVRGPTADVAVCVAELRSALEAPHVEPQEATE